ncbi:hypothetical protein [Clostridium cadaveris]|uniref:Uncharacterized protein n=1 Tax=Clostridium cadaveris TaxID=1529 RepID=A0A316M0Z5_9CLOT|nr:MAG: hypothetical protein DBY38_12150 [Clostridium cadaveris]
MKRENLRKVEVFELEYENNQTASKPLYQGYFHEYIKNASRPEAIIERENGLLEKVSIYNIRFLD